MLLHSTGKDRNATKKRSDPFPDHPIKRMPTKNMFISEFVYSQQSAYIYSIKIYKVNTTFWCKFFEDNFTPIYFIIV